MEFIDGATYKVTTTLTKSISTATAEVCTINASFTKKMPTDAPKFNYREGFARILSTSSQQEAATAYWLQATRVVHST